jgi:hypothetical protein
MGWQQEGKCWALDTGKGESDIFFEEWNLDIAREFCEECTVKKECLNEGLRTRSVGIWAGTTVGSRRYIRERTNRPSRPISLKISGTL